MVLTWTLAGATPAHIYKSFPPERKVLAEKKVPTEKPAVKPKSQTEKPAAVVARQVTPAAYHGTGDPYLDYIVQHESSGNPYAINSIGACGLFQAWPCEKLPCYLSDINCQINWGRSYAIQKYGSTYAAYAFWVANSWW